MQDLILDVVAVERELEAQTIVQELALETNLKLVLLLGTDALVTNPGVDVVVDVGVTTVDGTLAVGINGAVDAGGVTHDTERSADLTIVKPVGTLVLQHLREQNATADRRIPEGVVALLQGRGLLVADGTLDVCPVVITVACGQEHTGAEQFLLGHAGVLGAHRSVQVEPVLLAQTLTGAHVRTEVVLVTSVVTDVGGNVVDIVEGLVPAQHHVAVDDLILAVSQSVAVAVLTVGREHVRVLTVVLVFDLVIGQVGSDAGAQGQAGDDFPGGVHRTDEAVVALLLYLTHDVPEVLADQ